MSRKTYGFTIVELAIAIVVVAILVAITIVAYDAAQNRSAENALKADLQTASNQLGLALLRGEGYPSNLPDNLRGGNTDLDYSSDGRTYCITASSARDGITPYHITQEGVITEGVCGTSGGGGDPGPGPEPEPEPIIIANLHENPSIEVGQSSFGSPNGSAIARVTERAHTGNASLRVTMPGGRSSTNVGALILQRDVGDFFEPNTTYIVSTYVYVPTGTVNVSLSVQGNGWASRVNPSGNSTAVKNSWARIYNIFTTSNSGRVNLFVLNGSSTPAHNTQFWLDSVMVSKGDEVYPYADGSSPGWSWSGTPWTSSSQGPIL